MEYDRFFMRPGAWRILLNCLAPLPEDLAATRLAGVERVNAYQDAGEILALVWECHARDLAYAQAEVLWGLAVPARVVSEPREEFEFLRELIHLRSH